MWSLSMISVWAVELRFNSINLILCGLNMPPLRTWKSPSQKRSWNPKLALPAYFPIAKQGLLSLCMPKHLPPETLLLPTERIIKKRVWKQGCCNTHQRREFVLGTGDEKRRLWKNFWWVRGPSCLPGPRGRQLGKRKTARSLQLMKHNTLAPSPKLCVLSLAPSHM